MQFVDYRSIMKHYLYFLSHDNHTTDVKYVKPEDILYKSKIMTFLFNCHYSRLNKFVKLPFKHIWYKYLVPKIEDRNSELCFIITLANLIRFGENFVDYLHRKYKCKVVLIICDRIESYKIDFDFVRLKKVFDLICTYNPIDSCKYNIPLHPSLVYNLELDSIKVFQDRTTDIFYVGQEKGRGDQIVGIYKKCKSLGLRCEFYIVGNTNIPQVEGIHYCKWLSYTSIMEKMKNTKCILNVLQPGATGITMRDCEAYNLGCYLITDNPVKEMKEIFNDGQVIKLEDLNNEIANSIKNKVEQFPRRANEYTIDNFYQWIEKSL